MIRTTNSVREGLRILMVATAAAVAAQNTEKAAGDPGSPLSSQYVTELRAYVKAWEFLELGPLPRGAERFRS